MKYSFIKNTKQYLIIILSLDLIFILLMKALGLSIINFILFIILSSLLCIAIIVLIEINRNKKKRSLIKNFINNMDYESMEFLIDYLGDDYKPIINDFFIKNKRLNNNYQKQRSDIISYKDIMEEWAHNIKIPIAAMDLILENNATNIDPTTREKLSISNSMIKVELNRILYFARSTSYKKDYLIKEVNLREVADSALEEFYIFLSEREIIVESHIDYIKIMSDFYTLRFILSQIINNSVKYCKDRIILSTRIIDDKIYLIASNNGPKIYERDLPFIFDKGYTGKSTKNINSTGLGLYLVKTYADDLGIDVKVINNENGNFSIALIFDSISK